MVRILGLLAALLMLATTAVFAAPGQGAQGSGGWGMKGAYGRLYNPSTVTTVVGNVVAVNQMTPMKGMGPGIHVELKTDEGNVDVHLGPAWYLDRQDTRIQKGDRIEVKGSRVTVGGKPALIAAEVRKGDELLKLRDEQGIPVWSGWRRGQ
jgi:hypothetical protein